MKSLCPECKNNIDLSNQDGLAVGNVIECNSCGITLLVKALEGEDVTTEIVDEGK